MLAALLVLTTVGGGVEDPPVPGSLDAAFLSGVGANATVTQLLVLPDGRILVAGNFTQFEGEPRLSLVRLLPSGEVDDTFSHTGANGAVITLARQGDGRIIAGGDFTQFGGIPASRIVRLLPDGVPDPTFSSEAGVRGTATPAVMSVAVGPDDSLVLGGFFTHVNGVARPYVARLAKNGELDTTWQPQMTVSGYDGVLSVQVLDDWRVLVGGQFEQIDGVSQRSLALLTPEGDLDPEFRPQFSKPSAVFEICLLARDRILVGGYFVDIDGKSRRGIARLGANGALDETFDPGQAMNHQVNALAVQPDGRILAGGYFTEFNQHAVSRLVRLEPNGQLDASFQVLPGIEGGENPGVLALALQDNGGILVGGEFAVVHEIPRNRIARLWDDRDNTPPTPFSLEAEGLDGAGFHLRLLGEPGRRYTLERSENAVDWSAWTSLTAGTESAPVVDPGATATGFKFYRARSP